MHDDVRKAQHLEDSGIIMCRVAPLDCMSWGWKHYNSSTRHNVHSQDKE